MKTQISYFVRGIQFKEIGMIPVIPQTCVSSVTKIRLFFTFRNAKNVKLNDVNVS